MMNQPEMKDSKLNIMKLIEKTIQLMTQILF